MKLIKCSPIHGNYGYVQEILKYPDGPGIRKAREFLRKTIIDFASWNIKFHKTTSIFPIELRERQISGGLFKAMLNSGAQAMTQPYIRRKSYGTPESAGWADYLVYTGEIMWIIEAKHTYCRLNNYLKGELEWLTDDWQSAVRQIKTSKKSALVNWGQVSSTFFGVAFHTVLIYQRYKTQSRVSIVEKEEVAEYIKNLGDKLNPPPNWIWIWSLNQKLQKPVKSGVKWENYPAVCFFIHINPL